MGRAARAKAEERKRRAQNDGADNGEAKTWHYGYFLVAYIDLLGQRQQMMKLTELPHTPAAKAQALEILRKSAGRVRAIRRTLSDYIAQVSESRQPLVSFTAAQREEYLRIRDKIPFRVSTISDTTIIAVPLGEAEHGPGRGAIGVWSALYGIAGVMLTTMSVGIPLRAGIDIERAIDIFPGEAYGPALVNAYRLECEVAQYPRAAVGQGVFDYLAYLEQLPQTSASAIVATGMSSLCRKVLCEDPIDQQPMLHMLAPALMELGELFTKPAQMAHEWAAREFQQQQAAGNAKLTDRYRRLLEYFAAHGYGELLP